MIDAKQNVRADVVEHIERRSHQLARIHHVPFDDLLARYALASVDDGMLVVQIRYAGHILDKIMLASGEWEK